MSDQEDVLSQLATTFRLEGAVGGRFTLASPWGFALPKGEDAVLMVVVRGRVHFELRGAQTHTLELGSGDVVVLPHGDAHAISDDPRTALEEVRAIRSCPRASAEPHRGGQTDLVLLFCRFSDAPGNMLLRALPPLIHHAGHDGAVVNWLEPTVRLLASESAADAPGHTTILERLAEVAFLQLVRTWLENDEDCKGWLRVLRDSRITRALSAMHAEPAHAWTVESLAERAGMSRSSFASTFRQLVGETPLDYLTRWRMQQAAVLLRSGQAPIKEVVARAGYTSEAAFRTAFRKWMGASPSRYRSEQKTMSERAAAPGA